MTTIFTKIIQKELPGTFVWEDDRYVAVMSINPLRPGHVLVIPREEVAHWLDLDPDLLHHLNAVAQSIGLAIQQVYDPARVGSIYAGLEVPHVHQHLLPIDALEDLDFANAAAEVERADLEAEALKIRAALCDLGYAEVPDTGGGASPA